MTVIVNHLDHYLTEIVHCLDHIWLCQDVSTDPMCRCLGVCGSTPVGVRVGHLFLQQLSFTGHDCLHLGHYWEICCMSGL